jgi:hypothetical protein
LPSLSIRQTLGWKSLEKSTPLPTAGLELVIEGTYLLSGSVLNAFPALPSYRPSQSLCCANVYAVFQEALEQAGFFTLIWPLTTVQP